MNGSFSSCMLPRKLNDAGGGPHTSLMHTPHVPTLRFFCDGLSSAHSPSSLSQSADSRGQDPQNSSRMLSPTPRGHTHTQGQSWPAERVSSVLVTQSCLTLCNPMDCSPPGSSVHGILQARILEWVAFPFNRGSSQPTDQTWVSWIAEGFFTI